MVKNILYENSKKVQFLLLSWLYLALCYIPREMNNCVRYAARNLLTIKLEFCLG